jgi:hypothetical protein
MISIRAWGWQGKSSGVIDPIFAFLGCHWVLALEDTHG